MTENTALAVRQTDPAEWKVITEQAITLEQAGKGTGILPKGISNRYQIAAIAMKGAELGFGLMYSLEQIVLIDGKPVVQTQGLMSLLQRVHGRRAVEVLETDDMHCKVRFRDPADPQIKPLEIEWTMDDAKRADLVGKLGWKRYPRVMLRWRAIAEGARVYFADTISGVYTPDELNVPLKVEGEDLVIDRDALAAETGGSNGSADEQSAPSNVLDLRKAPSESTEWTEADFDIPDDLETAPAETQDRAALLRGMQERLEALAKRRGKNEKWVSLMKFAAGKMNLTGVKGPSDLTAEQVQAIRDWADRALNPPAAASPEPPPAVETEPEAKADAEPSGEEQTEPETSGEGLAF